jgi:hypothetical protein
MDYNHPRWPSPRAKVVVKNLKLDFDPDGNKIKRLTHHDAVCILAMKAGMAVQEFLDLPQEDSWKKLGCVTWKRGFLQLYDPLYIHSPWNYNCYRYSQ